MAKEKNKKDVESLCSRVTKHASKNMPKGLVWIDYEQLIMNFVIEYSNLWTV